MRRLASRRPLTTGLLTGAAVLGAAVTYLLHLNRTLDRALSTMASDTFDDVHL
jgi:hypothetical protein